VIGRRERVGFLRHGGERDWGVGCFSLGLFLLLSSVIRGIDFLRRSVIKECSKTIEINLFFFLETLFDWSFAC
jgi:hypothetical protein